VKKLASAVSRKHVHYAVVGAGVVAGLLEVLGAALNRNPDARINLLIYTPIEVLVGWTFLFVGLAAGRRRPDNPIGLLMSIFGLTWFTYALQWIHSPVPFYVGDAFRNVYLAVLAQLYIVYPRGRPAGRFERRAVWGVYFWFGFTVLTQLPTNDPVSNGCGQCLRNPFYIPGTSWLNHTMGNVGAYGTLVVAVFVLAVFAWHWSRASAPVRRAMTPAAWAALPVFGTLVAQTLAGVGVVPSQIQAVTVPFEWLTFAILPVGLLIGVLRTRLGRAAVGDLVVELSRLPVTGTLRDSLARTVGDPTLELALALPDGSYVDSRGAGLSLPPPGSGRSVTAIEADGRPLAALIHDPALNEDDPGLVAAAGSAARLALENERLQAEVRASLEEVRASRARILEAADAERQRLERDIHDGAQQRLVALGVALKLARNHAAMRGDDGLVVELEAAAGQLKDALSELRDLAQGIHPAVLSRAGIGPALRVLAELSPIPVDIKHGPLDRYPERVEAAVYFVVSEALTNAAKHSGARRVEVSVWRDREFLCVDVRDDGSGGADVNRGSGLVGMTDRVSVLGGRVETSSPPGEGTSIRARIPCE